MSYHDTPFETVDVTVNGITVTANIYPCDDPGPSPREEYSNLGTIAFFHRRYTLGDENPGSVGDWLADRIEDLGIEQDYVFTSEGRFDWYDFQHDLENDHRPAVAKAWDLVEPHLVALPLWFYEHSGRRIDTESFSGRALHAEWDSGRVGWIYVTKERARAEFRGGPLTAKRLEMIQARLRTEVEILNQWLSGDTWDVRVDEDGEDEEAAYVIYGLEYARDEAKYLAEEAALRKAERAASLVFTLPLQLQPALVSQPA